MSQSENPPDSTSLGGSQTQPKSRYGYLNPSEFGGEANGECAVLRCRCIYVLNLSLLDLTDPLCQTHKGRRCPPTSALTRQVCRNVDSCKLLITYLIA